MFAIAAFYFQSTLKVGTITQDSTRYQSSGTTCGVTVPDSFRDDGFDLNERDSTIFIVIRSVEESFVAAAAPCILIRWPTYGFIIFNTQFIETDISQLGNFHNQVYVTVTLFFIIDA